MILGRGLGPAETLDVGLHAQEIRGRPDEAPAAGQIEGMSGDEQIVDKLSGRPNPNGVFKIFLDAAGQKEDRQAEQGIMRFGPLRRSGVDEAHFEAIGL